MKDKISVYLASGWFTPYTVEILDYLESSLDKREDIELYSPRRDGIMLPPNQKHDTKLRESIFEENISKIKSSDLVIANIYSGDPYNDPGTMYEIGYAMANNVPVIGYSPTPANIESRFKGILNNIHVVIGDIIDLYKLLDDIVPELRGTKSTTKRYKALFVGNGDKDVDQKLVSYIMDSGVHVRWVNEYHDSVSTRIDEIFEDIDYLIAVVDDRKTLMSWMIGQAYARKIPVITYSNYNYGINVMLLASVLTHIRGTEELVSFLQQVNREGLESIPKFDISQLDSM